MDVLMLSGQLVDIRESKFHWVRKGVGVAHIVPLLSQRQHNFGRGKGQYLHRVSEGEQEMEIAVTL